MNSIDRDATLAEIQWQAEQEKQQGIEPLMRFENMMARYVALFDPPLAYPLPTSPPPPKPPA